MSKRFTNTRKWNDKWFRSLPIEAKLAWSYLNDECDLSGIIEPDYALATFQLGFDITPTVVLQWFDKKIFLFDDTRILLINFFAEQYGDTKDTWSAKIKACEKLTDAGFYFERSSVGKIARIADPFKYFRDITPPQWEDSGPTQLCIGTGEGLSEGVNTGPSLEKTNDQNSINFQSTDNLPEAIKNSPIYKRMMKTKGIPDAAK